MPWRPSRVHLAARRGALDLPLASIRYGADRFPWVVSRGAAMGEIYQIVIIFATPIGNFFGDVYRNAQLLEFELGQGGSHVATQTGGTAEPSKQQERKPIGH